MSQNKQPESNIQETTDFNNEFVHVKMTRSPGCKITFEITATPKAAAIAHQKAVKTVCKEVSLPGFRKGKAPEALVTKQFQKQIAQEWNQTMLQSAFADALDLTHLQPFRTESIRCTKMTPPTNDGATMTIQFQASPVVPNLDLNKISVPEVPLPPVSQADIDQVVKNLLQYQATWEKVDRPVQEGDYVDLDIVNVDEGEEVIYRDTRFEVTKDIMAPWMSALLLGKQTGDVVEGITERDPKMPADAEFQPTRVRLTIKAVQKATLPEVNDEFAQRIGTKSVTDLHEKIKIDLLNRAHEKAATEQRQLLDKALAEAYSFDIPEDIIVSEVMHRVDNHTEWLKSQNASAEEIEKQVADLEQRLPEEVDKGCRVSFLLLGYAKQTGLEISKEEVSHELSQQLAYTRGNLPGTENMEALRTRIAQGLILRKAKAMILAELAGKK